MESNCEKNKDRIAELITTGLSEDELHGLEQHLSDCSACSSYAEQLRKEDKLLGELIEQYNTRLIRRENQIMDSITQGIAPKQSRVISTVKAFLNGSVTKFAATAALIIFVTAYFVITLTWLFQIQMCIKYCS